MAAVRRRCSTAKPSRSGSPPRYARRTTACISESPAWPVGLTPQWIRFRSGSGAACGSLPSEPRRRAAAPRVHPRPRSLGALSPNRPRGCTPCRIHTPAAESCLVPVRCSVRSHRRRSDRRMGSVTWGRARCAGTANRSSAGPCRCPAGANCLLGAGDRNGDSVPGRRHAGQAGWLRELQRPLRRVLVGVGCGRRSCGAR